MNHDDVGFDGFEDADAVTGIVGLIISRRNICSHGTEGDGFAVSAFGIDDVDMEGRCFESVESRIGAGNFNLNVDIGGIACRAVAFCDDCDGLLRGILRWVECDRRGLDGGARGVGSGKSERDGRAGFDIENGAQLCRSAFVDREVFG